MQLRLIMGMDVHEPGCQIQPVRIDLLLGLCPRETSDASDLSVSHLDVSRIGGEAGPVNDGGRTNQQVRFVRHFFSFSRMVIVVVSTARSDREADPLAGT